MRPVLCILLAWFFIGEPGHIAGQSLPERHIPITVETVHYLAPVAQIDFEPWSNAFESGWFILSPAGISIAARTGLQEGRQFVVIWSDDGVVRDRLEVSGFIAEMIFPDEDTLLIVLADQVDLETTDVTLVNYSLATGTEDRQHVGAVPGLVVGLWVDEEGAVWIESQDASRGYVTHWKPAIATSENPATADASAVVRIGRIPLPYVVTSSLEGLVTLWNIEAGGVIHSADNGLGIPSVFGAINASATHLVWRDNDNQQLYLLDFVTGENREVALLNGDYAQWYFLDDAASVILAVNLGFVPNIYAWLGEEGQRVDLGAYRPCKRPQPDMARLSADGATLALGCDAGLELWRVVMPPSDEQG